MTLEQQQKLEETYVMHTFGRKPVEFVWGEGMRLWDDEGKEYLDFLVVRAAVHFLAQPRVDGLGLSKKAC